MRVKIHLTEPEHANNPVLGEIEISADMMIEELVSTLESLILMLTTTALISAKYSRPGLRRRELSCVRTTVRMRRSFTSTRL